VVTTSNGVVPLPRDADGPGGDGGDDRRGERRGAARASRILTPSSSSRRRPRCPTGVATTETTREVGDGGDVVPLCTCPQCPTWWRRGRRRARWGTRAVTRWATTPRVFPRGNSAGRRVR
jgi:hypothetical protein